MNEDFNRGLLVISDVPDLQLSISTAVNIVLVLMGLSKSVSCCRSFTKAQFDVIELQRCLVHFRSNSIVTNSKAAKVVTVQEQVIVTSRKFLVHNFKFVFLVEAEYCMRLLSLEVPQSDLLISGRCEVFIVHADTHRVDQVLVAIVSFLF